MSEEAKKEIERLAKVLGDLPPDIGKQVMREATGPPSAALPICGKRCSMSWGSIYELRRRRKRSTNSLIKSAQKGSHTMST